MTISTVVLSEIYAFVKEFQTNLFCFFQDKISFIGLTLVLSKINCHEKKANVVKGEEQTKRSLPSFTMLTFQYCFRKTNISQKNIGEKHQSKKRFEKNQTRGKSRVRHTDSVKA